MTKINSYWDNIFEKYKILDKIHNNGKFEISAAEINEFKEARLMTKFDNASQLPKVFTDNKLSILPITRGNYVIAPMKIFHDFPKIEHSGEIFYLEFPEHIQSLSPDSITSEALALNAAYLSGILKDFIEDEQISPTINGRMSSSTFDFNITSSLSNEDVRINVNNAQIEIDAGYEGAEYLSIIEAKNHLADDFVIRQLYYPLRLWTNNLKKQVKTIFMVYTNNMFYLYEYKFDDVQNYNSLKLSRFQRYSFEKMEISLEDIERILQNVKVVQEVSIPFPQADSFERVINLCELLYKSDLTKNDITVEYGFDKRQTDYYINAGKYLDLIKERDGIVSLSSTGRNIMDKSPTRRQLGFVRQILQHAVFNDVLKTQLKTGSLLSKSEIINKMKTYPLFNVKGESTYTRRSSTISSWINWITSLITI